MSGKKAGTKCPHCYEEEDIHHVAFDCTTARYIRKIVFKEWWSHTGDHACLITMDLKRHSSSKALTRWR
jgi:hypothetical protein